MTEQGQHDEDPYTNLATIVGRDDDYQDGRVAYFMPSSDKLIMGEACDDYFTIELDEVEVRRLRDWLDAWLVDRSRTS